MSSSASRPVIALAVVLAALVACMAVVVVMLARVPEPAEPVAIIGDSLTEKSVSFIPDVFAGSSFRPEVMYGRNGLSVNEVFHEELGKFPELPSTVLVALGTVDMRMHPPQEQREVLFKFLDALGPDRRIVWVNTYQDDNPSMPEVLPPDAPQGNTGFTLDTGFNELLLEARDRYSNLEVVDWWSFVDSGAGPQTNPDGIHYYPEGYLERARFYLAALNGEHAAP